jgi:hypothetical protein
MIATIDTSDAGLFLEFRWMSDQELRSGKKTCSLYVNGKEVNSCSNGDTDMRAMCLAEWFAVAYKDRLVKLHLSVDESLGMPAVNETIHECGLQIQLVYSEENHEVYRLTEIPVPMKPLRRQDTKAASIA